MVPYELKFHGIRDYEPTVIDLSGHGEHILIAGPNGSGKSTITFCMGAVLNSSKVDIEGLKSRNIQEDETWRASIHFLFKNEGPSQIDAPSFIVFSVHIEQEPLTPIKRVFTISAGDNLDSLTTESSFRSGGQPNFSDYRRQLTNKYKVYPDDYYLIWYQQEVNQFAIMSPEERFRVFSEMHGISNIQKNWESSLAQVKEIESSVGEAENTVQNDRFIMLTAKRMYDRFLAYEESIKRTGTIIIQSLIALLNRYRKELTTVEGTIEELTISRDDVMELLSELRDNQQLAQEKFADLVDKVNKLESERDRLKIGVEQTRKMEANLQETIHELSDLLREIEEKSKRLLYTEEETRAEYEGKEAQLSEFTNGMTELKSGEKAIEEESNRLVVERANLINTIEQYKVAEKEYAELLSEYESKHVVNEKIDALNESVVRNDAEINQLERKIKEVGTELAALKRNHIVSTRQQTVLNEMKRNKIVAYPMRSLVELDENASLKAEQKLDTIKYTIFYDGKNVTPVNDLYHVSFRDIVPSNFIERVPELQLRIKKGLTEREKNYAVKVLSWVKLFYSGNKPTIRAKKLIDVRGERGAQEHQTYILSEKALQIRKKELNKLLTLKQEKLAELLASRKKRVESVQHLYSIVQSVAKAEAFQLEKHKNTVNMARLTKVNERLATIVVEKQKFNNEITLLHEKMVRIGIEMEHLASDLDIYRQLGEQKGNYEQLHQAKNQLVKMSAKLRALQKALDQLGDAIRGVENRESKQKRKIKTIKRQLEDAEQEHFAITKQTENKGERKSILQSDILIGEKKLNEMKHLVPDLYTETIHLEALEDRSEMKLENDLIKAKNEFDLTREQPDINHESGNMYEKAKDHYEQKNGELKKLKALLMENKERAEENEQYLVTTIQMKVMRIHQLFQNYMTHFQFECDIDFDKYEERNGRIVFRLFIKVRKQGHRGRMEDVSLKARAGRVGKGVSGGEESLSSLLFALSLLQELDIKPSFIVLDEFDSALDDGRKAKVFDLYARELERKLIIISPKGHESEYLDYFHKAYIARHDPILLKSILAGVRNTRTVAEEIDVV